MFQKKGKKQNDSLLLCLPKWIKKKKSLLFIKHLKLSPRLRKTSGRYQKIWVGIITIMF